MPNISVHDFLKTSLPDVANSAPFSVAVVFGDDAFLKSQAVKKLRHDILAGDDAEFSFSRHDGSSVLFNTVIKDCFPGILCLNLSLSGLYWLKTRINL